MEVLLPQFQALATLITSNDFFIINIIIIVFVVVVVVTFIKQALMKLLTIRLRQMRGSKFSRGIDSDRLLFNNNNYCSNGAKQG